MNNRTFFVSSSSAGRTNIFQSKRMQSLFLDVLRHYKREQKYLLHAFVMMSDHIHLLITPQTGVTLEMCVQLIKGRFSHRAKEELKIQYDVWNPGFSKTTVKEQGHFLNVVAYIHNNPVRRGRVKSPELYECSSAWPGRRMDPSPFINAGAKAHSV
jgi:putative transposase